MMNPETRYVRSGRVHIAYQVVGSGPVDLVLVPGYISQVEVWWEEPEGARFLRGLSAFSRLIMFDKRGTGASDRVSNDELPSLEQRIDDLHAVLDAAGSRQAILLGISEGGLMSVLYAATHPDRVRALVLFGTAAAFPWGKGFSREEFLTWFNAEVIAGWGQGSSARLFCPSILGDARLMRWAGRWERVSASPGGALAIMGMATEMDVRHLLSSVHVPTLVAHRSGDRVVPVSAARYLARQIPGAQLRVYEGGDHTPFIGDADALVADIEEFVTGTRSGRDPDRTLTTVLFTDIVDSTGSAAALGDERWRARLDRHDAVAHNEVARHRGRVVKSTGDGILATFDGPARATHCALELVASLRAAGIEIRAGLHTGEVELRGGDVSGLTVHIAARALSVAGGGEVIVTSAVRDLVPGAGLVFEARGAPPLKGVPDAWSLFAARV